MLLTIGLFSTEQYSLLPGLWRLLYGAGILTGGAHSIRIVSHMSLFFMAIGTIGLFLPNWTDHILAIGFGLGHIGFGLVIARKHGG